MLCRVCDKTDLEPVIDLGVQPWGNNFLSEDLVGFEETYPLRVVFCNGCGTAQLDYTVKKEIMFSDHTYLSGVTKSLSEHFANIAVEVDKRFFEKETKKNVLDIGSNDGTQLKHYKALGYDVVGVESSRVTAEIANSNGINTVNGFFNRELARELGHKFNVVNASGVFFHLEELHSVTEGIRESLKPSGVFVVQFLYMKRIIENVAFDQIYHEHLLYYNLVTIDVLLNRHGLSMFDAYLSPIHGGSIIGFVSHTGVYDLTKRLKNMRDLEVAEKINSIDTYKKFQKSIELVKQENLRYVERAKKDGKTLYGMGAPVKGNTLLNYFGLGARHIDYLVEKNALRKGLFSPGMHIPIIMEDDVEIQPDIYYVLAWNFKEEILNNNRSLLEAGVEFYFPVNPSEVPK